MSWLQCNSNFWRVALHTRCICQVSSQYLKTCRKKPGKLFKKSKTHKNNRQNSENKVFAKNGIYVETYFKGLLMYQIWNIYLDLWGHDYKKIVWPGFSCKVGQSDPIVMEIKLDMSYLILNVYTNFEINMSKHVEKVKKTWTDRQTDGQTGGHCHGIIRPFFRWAY